MIDNPIRPDQIPLTQAVLCTNCETISATPNDCPACGSKSLLNLANILNRKGNENEKVQADKTAVVEKGDSNSPKAISEE